MLYTVYGFTMLEGKMVEKLIVRASSEEEAELRAKLIREDDSHIFLAEEYGCDDTTYYFGELHPSTRRLMKKYDEIWGRE